MLGLLDDAILLPFGILIAVRLIPAPLMKEIRETAARRQERPMSRSGMIAIFALWLAAAGFSVWLMLK